MWFTMSLIVILSAVVALWLAESRRRERAIERDWELVLTPRGERQLNRFATQVHDSLAVTDMTYARAREAHDRGDSERARHLIDTGCELIGAYAPRMTNALTAMAALSRMAAAVAPVRPLRADRFRLSQIVQVAHLARLLHHLAATTADRFRLRVYMLQRGFGVAAKIALRWRTAPPNLFDEVGELHHDVGVLSDESLTTLKALLVSMDAERRV